MEKKIKGIILMADGVEECEALITADILARSGIEVELVSIKKCHQVHSSHGVTIKTKTNYLELGDGYLNYDFLVLPGGKLGVDNLAKSKYVSKLVDYFSSEPSKLMCAICAAPSILSSRGYLKGVNYVCFPGFQGESGTWNDVGSIVDGKFITGRSMAYSIEFASNIVTYYLGKGGLDAAYAGIYGTNN